MQWCSGQGTQIELHGEGCMHILWYQQQSENKMLCRCEETILVH